MASTQAPTEFRKLQANYTQIDPATGKPYATLPWNDTEHFHPARCCQINISISISFFRPRSSRSILYIAFTRNREQIDGGKMDKFAAISSAEGLSMGYYHTSDFPVAMQEAANYTLCDHIFHSAFGGSWLNHIWTIAATTPRWNDAPESMRAILDKNGNLIKDGSVTPDGYLINTVYSVY